MTPYNHVIDREFTAIKRRSGLTHEGWLYTGDVWNTSVSPVNYQATIRSFVCKRKTLLLLGNDRGRVLGNCEVMSTATM